MSQKSYLLILIGLFYCSMFDSLSFHPISPLFMIMAIIFFSDMFSLHVIEYTSGSCHSRFSTNVILGTWELIKIKGKLNKDQLVF